MRVQVFDLDGNHVATWNDIHRPCALTVAPDGNIYIGELNGVALMEGALGIGHCAGYMVAGVTQEESIICQQLVGKYARAVFIHARVGQHRAVGRQRERDFANAEGRARRRSA